MIFELACNIFLLLFCIVSVINLELNLAPSAAGSMSAKTWPELLLVILIICFIFNIVLTYRKGKRNGEKLFALSPNVKELLNIKLLGAIALCLAYPVALNYLGYLLTTIIFLLVFIYLLGERRLRALLIWSVCITIVMYLLFHVVLSVPLPRGVGIFRSFALFLESVGL